MNNKAHRAAKIAAALSGQWMITEPAWQALAHLARSTATREACGDEDSPASTDSLLTKAGTVATIRIVGVLTKYASWYDHWLGLVSTERVMHALFDCANDDAVERVVIVFDCPGGNVAGTPELGELIAVVNAAKPIHAAISDCCCSGGLWLASQCGTISANATADIGSIGVYSVLVDDTAFWAEQGMKLTLVSTGGVKGKGADGKVDEELIAEIQRGNDDILASFITAVSNGRAMPREAIATLATGQTWRAEQAKELGLIDSVESIDDAIARLTEEVDVTPDQIRAFVKSNPKAARKMLAEATSAAAPAAPANLAGKPGDGAATLTWDAVEAATGYRLRRDGEEVYSGADATFADAELTNGTEYSYTVASLGEGDEESAESEAVAVTPVAEEAPAARGGKARFATATELKKAFPGEAAFILSRIDVPASLSDHKAAFNDTLKRRVATQQAEISNLKARLAKVDPAEAGTDSIDVETDAQANAERDKPGDDLLVRNMEARHKPAAAKR